MDISSLFLLDFSQRNPFSEFGLEINKFPQNPILIGFNKNPLKKKLKSLWKSDFIQELNKKNLPLKISQF